MTTTVLSNGSLDQAQSVLSGEMRDQGSSLVTYSEVVQGSTTRFEGYSKRCNG